MIKNCEHNWCQIKKDLPKKIGDKNLKKIVSIIGVKLKIVSIIGVKLKKTYQLFSLVKFYTKNSVTSAFIYKEISVYKEILYETV